MNSSNSRTPSTKPPKDQAQSPAGGYADGCLVDQLFIQFLAHVCGIGYLASQPNIHEGGVYAISSDSHWLVTGSYDKAARLWDLSAKDPATNPVVLRGHDDRVTSVAISPDNRWVVTGSYDKTARLWDLSAKDPAANPVILCYEAESPRLRSAGITTG